MASMLIIVKSRSLYTDRTFFGFVLWCPSGLLPPGKERQTQASFALVSTDRRASKERSGGASIWAKREVERHIERGGNIALATLVGLGWT